MEFVLGSCATKAPTRFPYAMENFDHQEPLDIPPRDFKTRSIHLWMLDFDKANRIEMAKDKKLLQLFSEMILINIRVPLRKRIITCRRSSLKSIPKLVGYFSSVEGHQRV